jgi:hypothetical protein
MSVRLAVVLMAVVSACGSDKFVGAADVSGAYSGPVTDGANSCPGVWDTGHSSDANVNVVQTSADVSVQVQGAAGLLLLTAGFGTNAFTGSVTGTHIDALIIGSSQVAAGACQYTFNGNLSADLSGDTLTGSIAYTPKTNGNADCTAMGITGCSRSQSFALNRAAKTP